MTLKFFAMLHIVAIEEKDIHTQLRASQCLRSTTTVIRDTAAVSSVA